MLQALAAKSVDLQRKSCAISTNPSFENTLVLLGHPGMGFSHDFISSILGQLKSLFYHSFKICSVIRALTLSLFLRLK